MTRKTIAIVLLVAPPAGLVIILVAFAIINAFISGASPSDTLTTVLRVVNAVLGLLGVVAVAGFLIGWPAALYLLLTKGKEKKS